MEIGTKLKKCMKFFQTKFYQLCLLFILIIIFSLLALFWFYPLPKAVDIEIRRNREASYCEQQLCLLNQWIHKSQSNAHISQIYEMCPGYDWSQRTNKTFELYQEQKVDWQFMNGYHGYYWYHFCHRKCGIDGPFRYFISAHNFDLQLPKAWFQHELCTSSYKTKDSCRWRAYYNTFMTYFSYFSIPLTIIINYINLTTLLQLLRKEDAGPALYLHTAEIVTDGLLNIIVGLHSGLYIFLSFDLWLDTCGYYQYGSAFQSMGVLRRVVSFLNQAYLMGLLVDRLHALTNPFHYDAMTDKQKKRKAKNIILKILLGSFTYYLPLFLLYTFSPIFQYWGEISKFWKENLDRIDFPLSNFYVIIKFSLLICQIIFGVLVEKNFRKYIENKKEMNQQSEVELKKRERDKQLLLGGTIGLNIITGLISTAFNTVNNITFSKLLGYSDQYPWWEFTFSMADPVLTFINGNGGLVIHILTVKSYRRAFKATRFGRLIFGNQQVHPSQQNQ